MGMPDRNAWPLISTNIARWFEENRQEFFAGSLKRMDAGNIPVARRTLAGEGELALKAYQLFVASGELAQYIPPSEGRAFVDLLYAQVCGTAIHDVVGYVRSYDEVRGHIRTVFARLVGDVVGYITENNLQSVIESYINLLDHFSVFDFTTRLAIAMAFDNQKQVERLLETGKRLMDTIMEQYKDQGVEQE